MRGKSSSGVKFYYTNGLSKAFSVKCQSFQWFWLACNQALLTKNIKGKTASDVPTAAFLHYFNEERDGKDIGEHPFCYHASALVDYEIIHKICSLHHNVINSSVYRCLIVFLTGRLFFNNSYWYGFSWLDFTKNEGLLLLWISLTMDWNQGGNNIIIDHEFRPT